jgi:hypothetical protein|tara:strand:- start:419 stop:625 length:207 start_codon:yes stop_codon:yes gene_type:complete
MMKKMVIKQSMLLVMFGALTLTVSGCREEEQNRILSYDKGNYLGQADTALTKDEESALKSHVMRQYAW